MSQSTQAIPVVPVTSSSTPPTPSELPHPVVRTLRQPESTRPTSFASAVSTSAVLANLDTIFQSNQHCGIVSAVSSIVTGMSSVISEMRSEIDNSRPLEDVAVSNDVNTLRQKLSTLQRTNHMMSMHMDLLELKKQLEAEEVKKADDRKTFVVASREELYKEIVELLEAEFGCSICNEIFVSPSVTKCGHTFCELCISRFGIF
jgi:regulator of replication initiation timing